MMHLPKNKLLNVPKNMKLTAVPFFDLHENVVRYGPQLAALPLMLSRFAFINTCIYALIFRKYGLGSMDVNF